MEASKGKELKNLSPSTKGLQMAIDLAKNSEESWATDRIIRTAALFDLYLRDRILFSINDSNSFRDGFADLLLSSIEISHIRVNNNPIIPTVCAHRFPNGSRNCPDQVFSGHSGITAHNQPPSFDDVPSSDSSSDGNNKSVAPDAGQAQKGVA